MIDINKILEDFDFVLFKSRMSITSFTTYLDRIGQFDLKELNQQQLMAAFKNHRNMASATVLLLNHANESLLLEKPDLKEVQEILKVTIQATQLLQIALSQAGDAGFKISEKRASGRGRAAAEALHSKSGGSRSKADEMRRLWAGGKYSSRDVCAEQECGALGMSFSTARKALIGTPKPT